MAVTIAGGKSSAPKGTVFGYEIQSDLGFQYLRSGSGERLEVVEHNRGRPMEDGRLLIDWPPREGRPAHVRLRELAGRLEYGLWISDAGWFIVHPSVPRIEVPPTDDLLRREERLWGLPSLLCFMHHGDLPLHAAAIEHDGTVILIAGPSRHGKTTLTAAFWKAGYRVLSEDLSRVQLGPTPTVVPGPAMLRVRRDVADKLSLNAVRRVGLDEDRLHLALDDARVGDCRPVPIRALVMLHPAETDITMKRLRPTDAVPDLWILTFHLPQADHQAHSFGQVGDFAARVPIWKLSRPLRFDQLDQTIESIVKETATNA